MSRDCVQRNRLGSLTGSRGVLAVEVTGLVASDDAGALGLRSSTTGQTGVEVHDTVHTGSILGSTNRLFSSNVSHEYNSSQYGPSMNAIGFRERG